VNTHTIDVLLISASEQECAAVREICSEFGYELRILPSFGAALESSEDARVTILSDSGLPADVSVTEGAQGLKQMIPQAFQISLMERELPKEKSTFLRKCGSDMIALRSELLDTSKFWFAISQVLRATYLPIKSVDMVENVEVPFNVFHLLPERKKFIPFIFSGDIISPAKMEKVRKVSEFYFHRSEATGYQRFVDQTTDMSAAGLAKRCRAVFLALQAEFTELAVAISDQSDLASFGDGQVLVGRCQQLCEDLLKTLGEFPKAWEIINASSIGDFGSLERAPAVSAYCGLFALLMGLPNIPNLMLTALLCDFGFLRLNSGLTRKLRENRGLTPELEAQISAVPETSLQMILQRKLSIDEKSRNILISTYERADGKGFPKKIDHLKLSTGAQLIRFSRWFDQSTLLRMGEARKSPLNIFQHFSRNEKPGEVYTEKFLSLLQQHVISAEAFHDPK
jgi:response regulator RpfG family c-di-GMP phosphodiesterase